jgi:DNA replication licensing factor MCM4
LIFLVLDKPDKDTDARLARHIVDLYTRTPNLRGEELVDVQTLRDYIAYARAYIQPAISEEAGQFIAEEYVRMRKNEGNRKTITATTRQLESLIRLAEAHARIRFSHVVERKDVFEAARLIRVALQQAATDPRTGTIDMDLIATGAFFVSVHVQQESVVLGRSATSRERLHDLCQALRSVFTALNPGTPIKFAHALERMKQQSSVVRAFHSPPILTVATGDTAF